MTGTNIQSEGEKKHPDFPQWLKTKNGIECNNISNLSEQRFLTNRLSWAFDAGRNCVWDQFQEGKTKIAKLEKEIEHMKSCSFNDACEIGELKQENAHLGNIAHEVNRMMTEVATLEQENKELREALTHHKTLIAALDKYITILDAEISSLVPIAHVHGWRSDLVEKGKEIRELIDRASKLLEP